MAYVQPKGPKVNARCLKTGAFLCRAEVIRLRVRLDRCVQRVLSRTSRDLPRGRRLKRLNTRCGSGASSGANSPGIGPHARCLLSATPRSSGSAGTAGRCGPCRPRTTPGAAIFCPGAGAGRSSTGWRPCLGAVWGPSLRAGSGCPAGGCGKARRRKAGPWFRKKACLRTLSTEGWPTAAAD